MSKSKAVPFDMQGATIAVSGKRGGVPTPTTADVNKFLRGTGLWASVSEAGETYIAVTFATAPLATPYTVTVGMQNVYVNHAGGNCGIKLPSAVTYAGRVVTVTQTSEDYYSTTVTAVAGLVQGASSAVIPGGSLISLTFKSDGTNWRIT